MQIDDPPTRPGFITALDDAYLMPREDGYAVFCRTSGRDLCTVRPEVAERALRRQGTVVRLGTWSGTLRGRADDWTLWWARGVPWAATSDVADGEQILPLIERWQTELARAQAHGQRWEPLPPGVARPAGAPVAPRPRPAGVARSRVLGGLRALFRAQLARRRVRAHMIAVIAGGDGDRGTDVREQMTRSAALLFGERGFSGTGLRDVIAHSSTPRGSIYHHFAGGKAELAREAVRHAADEVAGPVGDAARGGDPIAALHAWLDHWRERSERSDFHAGSAMLAVRDRARRADRRPRGRRGGLRRLGRRVRRHAAGVGPEAQEGRSPRHARRWRRSRARSRLPRARRHASRSTRSGASSRPRSTPRASIEGGGGAVPAVRKRRGGRGA